jgi:hypothetical protein
MTPEELQDLMEDIEERAAGKLARRKARLDTASALLGVPELVNDPHLAPRAGDIAKELDERRAQTTEDRKRFTERLAALRKDLGVTKGRRRAVRSSG